MLLVELYSFYYLIICDNDLIIIKEELKYFFDDFDFNMYFNRY